MRRLPDIPRCTIKWPSPQSKSRYLPRRRTPRTVRPASLRTPCGTGQRRRGSRIATAEMRRPASCGAMPRRVTSTSGSSGTGTILPKRSTLSGTKFPMLKRFALALAFAATAAGAAAQPSDAKKIPQAGDAGAQGLSEPTLYEFLLGEIALQRGDFRTAAETYLDLAKRTRDPRVARRAVEVANQGRLTDLALEAAKTWLDIEPQSTAALQVSTALLVSAKRVDEAEPYLEKLLASPGVNAESGFLQINRLLAGNPDKGANLRVVRKLAAKYPQLPQAHFAIAQAALAAGQEGDALKAIRRAEE